MAALSHHYHNIKLGAYWHSGKHRNFR